jgi:photosystem II stability/assembly factor-like uncharacterized protein
MQTKRILVLIGRISLFALILGLGTLAALVADETQGLALADLSEASVQTITGTPEGEVLYASLDGGVQPAGIYRSDDAGRTWQPVSTGPGIAVNKLAVQPSSSQAEAILYANTGGAQVKDSLWLSYDRGHTWHRAPLQLPSSPYGEIPNVSVLAADPHRPGVLYIGTDGHGVYRFEMTENRLGLELIGGISMVEVHVDDLLPGPDGRLYALTREGAFVIEGDVWQALAVPEAAASLAVSPDDPQRLYAGGVSTGIYRSFDGGKTWEQANTGLEIIPGVALRVTALAIDEQSPRHLVAATAYGIGGRLTAADIFESQNGGDSWTRLAKADDIVARLTLSPRGLYATTPSGLNHYGEPIQPAASVALPGLRSLAHPSGVQVLILTLTLALAGLVLVGRAEWVLRSRSPDTWS